MINNDHLVTMQCSSYEIIDPGIHVDATWTQTTHPDTFAGQVPPLKAPAGSAPPAGQCSLPHWKNFPGVARGQRAMTKG